MMPSYKRYCKTLKLKNDPELIENYKRLHAPGNVWPEILDGMREIGILNMEIYLLENQLFMIMDTVPDFDHDSAMEELSTKPRQAEWEAWVARFQQSSSDATAGEKWNLTERIFSMEEQ